MIRIIGAVVSLMIASSMPAIAADWTPARIGLLGPHSVPSIEGARDVRGVDFAFLTTWSRDVYGLQVAPITLARTSTGLRFGILNLYGRECFECQSKYLSSRGMSVGLLNADETTKGVSLGGFNVGAEFHGVQIGVVNGTRDGNGLQIGVVNIARDSFQGIQIGLVNFIGDGAGLPVMIGANARF